MLSLKIHIPIMNLLLIPTTWNPWDIRTVHHFDICSRCMLGCACFQGNVLQGQMRKFGVYCCGKIQFLKCTKINWQSRLRHYFFSPAERRSVKFHACICMLCRCGGFVCSNLGKINNSWKLMWLDLLSTKLLIFLMLWKFHCHPMVIRFW